MFLHQLSPQTDGISTDHNDTKSFENKSAVRSFKTPNFGVLSLNNDNSNSLSFASLNTSKLEPGKVVTPMKSKESQGLMDTSFAERRRERGHHFVDFWLTEWMDYFSAVSPTSVWPSSTHYPRLPRKKHF
ncbi:unnamed protein product, partial [Mesorhabditis belari]|uniref:Uncharacterized protein n=1 Tax=Mesorhabditis belari TaxID=2138241 RepID=A0AAF3ERT5_9BILA